MRAEERLREDLAILLRTLHLPSFVALHKDVAKKAEKGGWSFDQYLHHLAEQEIEDRRRRKIVRLLKQSGLPHHKTLRDAYVAKTGCEPSVRGVRPASGLRVRHLHED